MRAGELINELSKLDSMSLVVFFQGNDFRLVKKVHHTDGQPGFAYLELVEADKG